MRVATEGITPQPKAVDINYGFHVDNTKKAVRADVTALGGNVHAGADGFRASVGVASVNVSTSNASGIVSGSFKAEAFKASANLGFDPEASKTGVKVYSAGVQAVVAKTTVQGSVNLGHIQIGLSGSVGYGGGIGASVGLNSKGLSIGTQFGMGAVFGGGLTITWK